MNAREQAYARVLVWVERHRAHMLKARSGTLEHRAFYQRMAARDEQVAGALLEIARLVQN